MKFEETPLQDVYLLEPKVFGDQRGFFLETWNSDTFREAGFDIKFVQDNHSRSARGILRGLHYQTEHTQGKLVRVTSGEVFDVVVDLRRARPPWAVVRRTPQRRKPHDAVGAAGFRPRLLCHLRLRRLPVQVHGYLSPGQ